MEITDIGMLYLDILRIFITAQIKNSHAQENSVFEQISTLSLFKCKIYASVLKPVNAVCLDVSQWYIILVHITALDFHVFSKL